MATYTLLQRIGSRLKNVTITTGTNNIAGTVGKLLKFTASDAAGDSIVSDDGSKVSVAGNVGATGTVIELDGSGAWRDQLVQIIPPGSGTTVPVLTQIGASNMRAPLWQIGDLSWFWIHAQHDLLEGLDVEFHVHWFTDGTQTNAVRWQFELWHAKGHNQGNFGFGSAGTIVTCQENYHGTAYRHMVTTTALTTISGLEPDSLIGVTLSRVTNGATENTNNVFAVQADMHYRSKLGGTKNKAPNFNT